MVGSGVLYHELSGAEGMLTRVPSAPMQPDHYASCASRAHECIPGTNSRNCSQPSTAAQLRGLREALRRGGWARRSRPADRGLEAFYELFHERFLPGVGVEPVARNAFESIARPLHARLPARRGPFRASAHRAPARARRHSRRPAPSSGPTLQRAPRRCACRACRASPPTRATAQSCTRRCRATRPAACACASPSSRQARSCSRPPPASPFRAGARPEAQLARRDGGAGASGRRPSRATTDGASHLLHGAWAARAGVLRRRRCRLDEEDLDGLLRRQGYGSGCASHC